MTAAESFRRALRCLLDYDAVAYARVFAPHAVLEWPFAPAGFPRRLEGREAIEAHVGANLERSRAAGRRLLAVDDVVLHEVSDRELVAEFTVELRDAAGATSRLPYVHVLTTTEQGEIAVLRDYFGPQTAQHASRQAPA